MDSMSPSTAPRLFTFDIFGTVLDWRRGLVEALAGDGQVLRTSQFDAIVDRQGELESEGPFRSYRDITAQSLVELAGLDRARARSIGETLGHWPLFPDSSAALAELMVTAPCVAMTNSDRAHGRQVQAALGFDLSAWVCAEEVRLYKPDPRFFREVARRLEVTPGPEWWHVSAYADYDLATASSLGLTTVFVERPHARPGPATHRVPDLAALADLFTA
jgi:2-haloacid dehalogenase